MPDNLEWCSSVPGIEGAPGAHHLIYIGAQKVLGKRGLVLDAGCGRCCGVKLLSQTCSFVIGFDIDENVYDWFQEHEIKNGWVFQAAAEEVTFPPMFDAIVSVEVFEHLEDYVPIGRRLIDALLPGGVLFFSVPIADASQGHFHRELSEENFAFLGDVEWKYCNWRTIVDKKTDVDGFRNLIGIVRK